MTEKKDMSDEDRAALERMLASREESRRKRAAAAAATAGSAPAPGAVPDAATDGAMARRWASESFLGDDSDEVNAPLPSNTPVGIVASQRSDGGVRYRDGRCRFSITIPQLAGGKPVFVAAEGGADATCRLGERAITVSFVMVPPQPGAPLAAQVEALASDIAQATASTLARGRGVEAAATATLIQGDDVRDVAVLAGGAAGACGIVIVMLDRDRRTVDDSTAAGLRTALLESAAFAS